LGWIDEIVKEKWVASFRKKEVPVSEVV